MCLNRRNRFSSGEGHIKIRWFSHEDGHIKIHWFSIYGIVIHCCFSGAQDTNTSLYIVVNSDEIHQPFTSLDSTGFPQALEIMENHKKSSMHGKIMEFEKT